MKPPEITSNDSDNASDAFYGGTVELNLYGDVTSNLTQSLAAGTVLTVTLVPNGPLIDGSSGQTLVKQVTVHQSGKTYYYLRNIPIGAYTASVQANNSSLKVNASTVYGGSFSDSTTCEFEPNASGSGARRIRLNLTQ